MVRKNEEGTDGTPLASVPAGSLIVTGASESYSRQLLALIGSLQCNWRAHPPLLVYDLGLSDSTLERLNNAGIQVRKVPAFVPHWRKHYTWKLWCINDAPAERVLWLDSGCCILRPAPEIFEILGSQGYFVVPNYERLEAEASLEACAGCRVDPAFRIGKGSIAANVFGFTRVTPVEDLVKEALAISLVERHIEATRPEHRHDQAILSLLLHRDIHPLVFCDGHIYGFEDLEARFTTHAIWAVRRGMHYKDIEFYAGALGKSPEPHLPRSSHKLTPWYRLAWWAKSLLDASIQFGREKKLLNGVK